MAEQKTIPIVKIRENAVQLRPVDTESIDFLSLADSIGKRGVLNPIVVREIPDPEKVGEVLYGLVDGLHRYHASMHAGLKEIPANIITADQAEVEELQIIANLRRVETKPIQYTKQLERLLLRNPLMTVPELASKLSTTPQWLYERFGLLKLAEDIQKLVDDGRIKLGNAHQLSKLPEEERPAWIDRAMTQPPKEFTAAVSARKKEVEAAKRAGRALNPPTFAPTLHARKWSEVKDEFVSGVTGPTLIGKVYGNSDPAALQARQEGFALAIQWACHMDPDSRAAQIADNEAREKKKKADADARKKEREEKKAQEAAGVANAVAAAAQNGAVAQPETAGAAS